MGTILPDPFGGSEAMRTTQAIYCIPTKLWRIIAHDFTIQDVANMCKSRGRARRDVANSWWEVILQSELPQHADQMAPGDHSHPEILIACHWLNVKNPSRILVPINGTANEMPAPNLHSDFKCSRAEWRIASKRDLYKRGLADWLFDVAVNAMSDYAGYAKT